MDAGRYVFVIEIPPKFEQDIISNRYPSMQINMDATAVAQAGNGGAYLQQIINQVVQTYATRAAGTATTPSGMSFSRSTSPSASCSTPISSRNGSPR